MPCIEYKGKKYTYEEFGAMLKDGAFAKMVKSGELKTENLGAQVPSSLLEVTRRKIAPETSSNFANLTTDENGNYVFFHRGAKGYEEVRPGTGQSGVTPSNEAAAIGRVGGVAMYYTNPTDSEKMVSGEAQYAVTVAPDEVYDFNEDPENYLEEARARFKAEYPNMAFDANNQLAYITKIAGENGYKMVVAEWNGKTRAQTTEAMKPTDVRLQEGDRVVKDFDKKYTTNKEKGFESVIPETKDSKLKTLYNEIYKIRNDQKRYDGLYSLEEKYVKMSQDEITDLIMNSDLSDDIKQRYQEILSEKEGKRRSEKKSKIAENTKAEVDRIKSLDEKAEDGATFNLDGTTYEGVGLVVPVASVNTTMEELTPEMISDFVEQQKEKIGDDTVVKVGLYKFPNSNQVSIDLNIVAPESSRDVAIEFGRLAGQESLFDLSTYENIKTGATGANPINFNAKQFKEIAKALKEGKMPNVFEKTESFFEVSNLQEQVDNAKKAMAKLYPELNFVIHDSYDDYNALAQDEEGLESAGFFDSTNNTIHINKRAAEDNTVAHEVFHAVLFKMFGSDENINKNAKAMLKAIAKEIKSDQKLKEYLENFIANYDENVKNEEKLTELFAQIAAGYAQLNKKERSLIERFLNKLAELLGLRPFKTDEVLDLLNVLSAKITTGEAVTVEDVGAYGYGRAFVENPINEVKKSKKIGSKKTTIEIVYAEQDRIEELIKNGLLKQVEDISEFNDMYATTTSPDDMLVGSILINGKVKAEGNGGVFFVTKFGDVWASSNPVIAEQIKNRINKSIKINGGKGYLVLVKGSDAKLISSPQGASSSLKVVESLVMDGLISPSDFRKAVIAAIEENKDTKAKINFSGKLSSSDMISAVDSLFDDVSKSSFDNRGYLLKSIITELGKTESVKKNNSKIIEFLGGDVNKNIGWSPTSKTTNTSQSAIDLIANVSREELTKGLNNGDIYALIEVDDEVFVKEDKHKSYPFHIKQKNGKNPKLILLKNRQSGREVMVSESMEDNETLGKSFDGKVLGRASNGYGEGFIKSTPKFQRSTVAKKIEKALASGMSEAEVVADMVKAGYTEAEAKAYIDQYNAMRSDEYNRVKENIKGIIEKVEKRAGKDANPKKVRERKYNDAMNYLQESLWYENASDTEREAAVRELRKDLGFSERQAPTAEKVTKGAKDLVTVDSMKLVLQSIKDQNIGAKAALKDLREKREALREALRSLVKAGKITNRQASVMINRAMSVNLNNDEAVNKLIKYIEKVYNNSEIADKMGKANAMRRTAKKNIRSKIGGAKVAFPLLDKLFSIDSREIPISVLDTYVNIVNQFGKRVGVLSTENMSKVIQDTQDVLDAVNQELSKAQDLAMIFEMYPDKVLDANGEVLFDKTVEKMKRDGYIDEDTAKEMDEYRSDIFKKERATKEEDEQERKDLIAEISSARLVTSSRIGDPNERKAAREIIEMARSRRLLKKLSTTSLRNLAAIMKNIDAGFFPNYGVKLMQAMQIEQQAPMVNETLNNVSLRAISTAYNSLKALLTRDGFSKFWNKTIEKTLESNMTMDFDFMLGDNKKRNIYNYIIKPLAKAYASFEADSTAIKEKMSEAVNMLESQFNGNPNKIAESKFKMMAYMLQKEFETNPNQKGVAPAIDFINQTIKAIKARDTQYSEKDIEILEGIKANYMTNNQIDTNKIFDSLSPKEVKALRIVEEVNKSMYDKAIFTSGVIRGNRTQMYNNYVPHNVISRNVDHNSKITSVMNAYNNTQAVGTKAGSLQARVPGAKPIMFDPFLASMNSAIDVLLDFHMTVPMQTTSKLIQRVKSDINNNPNSKDISKDAINAIEQVRDNIAKFVFTSNKYYDDSILSSMGKSFLGTMYRNTLASVPRFANELISNFSYVIANPVNWVTGTKYIFKDSDYINGVSLRDTMSAVGSTVIGKVCGKQNTGKFSDVGFLDSNDVAHGSKSKSSFEATKDVIAKFSTKPVAKTTEYIGEVLMSTPDLLMSRPIWIGSFANEFKKQTGVDVEIGKLTDEKYRNKYKSAIEAATEHADNEVVQAGSTVNPFQKAAKMNVDPSSPTYKKLFARANNFLTNFLITEFSTARAAVYSLVSEGRMPKKKAAAVLIGVYMRVVMYTLLQNAISGMFYGILGYDDDDEETITWDDVVQAASSGLISLLINRNFGNIFKIAENYGVEKMNEEYGDFLRSGEDYDPYKHSLVFNKIQDKDIARKGPLRIAAVNLAGPYGKTVETAYKIEDIVKAESKEIKSMKDARSEVMSRPKIEKMKDEVLFNVATGSGLVPFAKDIRPIVSGKYKKKGED